MKKRRNVKGFAIGEFTRAGHDERFTGDKVEAKFSHHAQNSSELVEKLREEMFSKN